MPSPLYTDCDLQIYIQIVIYRYADSDLQIYRYTGCDLQIYRLWYMILASPFPSHQTSLLLGCTLWMCALDHPGKRNDWQGEAKNKESWTALEKNEWTMIGKETQKRSLEPPWQKRKGLTMIGKEAPKLWLLFKIKKSEDTWDPSRVRTAQKEEREKLCSTCVKSSISFKNLILMPRKSYLTLGSPSGPGCDASRSPSYVRV